MKMNLHQMQNRGTGRRAFGSHTTSFSLFSAVPCGVCSPQHTVALAPVSCGVWTGPTCGECHVYSSLYSVIKIPR